MIFPVTFRKDKQKQNWSIPGDVSNDVSYIEELSSVMELMHNFVAEISDFQWVLLRIHNIL